MSSKKEALCVRDLNKCYEIYATPQDRLRQSIHPRVQRLMGRRAKNYYREFWALKDVSFEVNKGEAVGIIGRNGAGKSTLLQIICGTLSPTSGTVHVSGAVAALLELGSGFNPEFTGRENVYLSASLLGLTKKQIDDKFDAIADFADIGEFLEQPIKTYSSGMLMRLAFAVNSCVEPDILIVDEALGVGDVPFQAKCFKRLRHLIDIGTSLLFVSHDIASVGSICQRALWLNNGHTQMWGDAKSVVGEYEKFCWKAQGVVLEPYANSPAGTSGVAALEPAMPKDSSVTAHDSVPAELFQPNPAFEENRRRSRMGTGDVIVQNFLMVNETGHQVTSCNYNELLTLYYYLEICRSVASDFVLGVRFRDLKGNFVYSANHTNSILRIEGVSGDRFVAWTSLRIPLTHQDYVILTGVFGFCDGTAFTHGIYDFSKSVIWDVIEDAAYLKVHPHKFMPLAGPVNASFDVRLEKLN